MGGKADVGNIRRHAYSWGDFNARDVRKSDLLSKGIRPWSTLRGKLSLASFIFNLFLKN